jgi:hypothetical protein
MRPQALSTGISDGGCLYVHSCCAQEGRGREETLPVRSCGGRLLLAQQGSHSILFSSDIVVLTFELPSFCGILLAVSLVKGPIVLRKVDEGLSPARAVRPSHL